MSSARPAVPLYALPEVAARKWQILAVMCTALVMVVMSVSGLNVAIPTLVEDLQATNTELQWIIDAYPLVFAGMLLTGGAIGDRFGRKGALMAGLGVFALGSILASFATSPALLIGTRAIMGFGAAFIMPATLSLITSVFPPQERGKAIATWAGFAGAGGAIGPVLSGLVLTKYWWGAVFLANLPFVLGVLLLVALISPTSRDEHATKLDPIGAVLSIAGLGLLLIAIIEGPERGWLSGEVLGGFAVSFAIIAAFVKWELHTRHPMLPMRFFRERRLSVGAGAITVAFFAMFGLFFMLTQYLQFVREYSPLLAAVAALPSAATLIVVAPRSDKVTSKLGLRRTLALGFAFMTLGFGLLSFLTPNAPYVMIAAGLVLLAGGLALIMPPSTSAIMESIPMDKAGVGSALNDTTRELGGSLGIAVLGSIASSVYRSSVDGSALPEQVRDIATESIGGAVRVTSQIGEQALPFLTDAQAAFTDAFNATMGASAVIGAIGLIATLVLLKKHDLAPEHFGGDIPHSPSVPVVDDADLTSVSA